MKTKIKKGQEVTVGNFTLTAKKNVRIETNKEVKVKAPNK